MEYDSEDDDSYGSDDDKEYVKPPNIPLDFEPGFNIKAVGNPLHDVTDYHSEGEDSNSDCEFSDPEWDSKKQVYDTITPEKFRDWRNNLHQEHVLTQKTLNQYKKSNELLKALDQRLKDDPEGRAYFDSKLMMSKTPYNRVLRKNILRDGATAGVEYEKWIERLAKE